MSIRLTPEQEQLVHRKLDSGHYGSAREVIDEALRLIDARDRFDDLRIGDPRAKIAAGVASLRAGRTVDGETAFDRLDAELDAEERRGGA